MKRVGVLLVAGALASDVTPIQKVIEMMNGMISKGKEEKHKEEVEFNAFKVWCDNTRAATEQAIKDGADKIVQLEADRDKAEADAEQLKTEIGELEASIATAEDELKAATKIRNKENADYKATHFDLSESVDALDRAISVLKSKAGSIPQASLLQIKNMQQITEHEKAVISSFLAMSTQSESGAPEANGYEFQSGGVVSMLEKLKLKFEDQRLAVEKAEMSAKANFEVLSQQLNDDIRDMQKSVAEKTEKKAERLADAAEAKGDLEITTAAKAEDETKLTDTNAECVARSQEYEENQVLRSEEIKAISTAQEILASPEVSGNAEKHLPQFLQGSALAQLRADVRNNNQARVAAYLQAQGAALGSRVLSAIAIQLLMIFSLK